MNRRKSHNRKLRIINLLYKSSKSLSFSVKKSKAKQIHIPKIKNQNRSYFALKMKAFIQTCWIQIAKSKKTNVVIINIRMNWMINFDCVFFNNNFRVILLIFSLFFIALIRHFRCVKTYRSIITMNISNINSFHIQISVQIFPSRHNLKVTKVCKKNCSKSQITNILHNKLIRNLKSLEQMLDHRDVSFFIV